MYAPEFLIYTTGTKYRHLHTRTHCEQEATDWVRAGFRVTVRRADPAGLFGFVYESLNDYLRIC